MTPPVPPPMRIVFKGWWTRELSMEEAEIYHLKQAAKCLAKKDRATSDWHLTEAVRNRLWADKAVNDT